MCNAFSCLVLRDGSVVWKMGIDSHDELLKLTECRDDTIDPDKIEFCRIEISPENEDYLNPDKWIYKIDMKPIPNWLEEFHEQNCWTAFHEWKAELDTILIRKPIIHPFRDVQFSGEITPEILDLVRDWASVWASVRGSVGASVRGSVGASVWASVTDSVGASVGASVWASVWAYTGSFFNLPRSSWKYTENIPGSGYPFQSVVTLWEMGLIPSFDGTTWRLHAGPDGKIVGEGVI